MIALIQQSTVQYSRRRFACLFFSLVFTMMAAPLFGALGLSTRFLEVFLACNILAAAAITLFQIGIRLGVGLLAMVLVTRGAHAIFGYEPLLTTSQGVSAAICLLSAVIILRFVLGEGSVTSERIYAALDVYLLIGITCGLLFCVIEQQWPGSFSFRGSSFEGDGRTVLAHTIYFSFVTLGTLGYGDVLPVGGLARSLAVAESICGQMYLVVVVARLVSLYEGRAEHGHRKRTDPHPQDKVPRT